MSQKEGLWVLQARNKGAIFILFQPTTTTTTTTTGWTFLLLLLLRNIYIFTCMPAMLRACMVFGSISLCVSVCLHKISKLLMRNQCNLIGIWPMENATSAWKLVTFDLDSCFRIFSNSGYTFQMA